MNLPSHSTSPARLRHCQHRQGASLCLMTALLAVAANSSAREPLRQVLLAEQKGTTIAGAPFNLLIQSSTVQQIEVTTRISTWNGEIISQPDTVTIAIDQTDQTEPADVDSGGRELVVSVSGYTVIIDNPHHVDLAPGMYEERIIVGVTDAELDYSVEDVYARLVEISDQGSRPLEPEEFSELVEPKVTTVDRYGDPILAIVGVAGPAVRPEEPLEQHQDVMVESGDPNVRIPQAPPVEIVENDEMGGF